MNGLIIFLGESFRLVSQGARNRGDIKSFDGQIQACNSHINFIKHIIQKYDMNTISVFIASYNTVFNDDLLKIYNDYLIGNIMYDNVIGLNNLFHNSINTIKNIDDTKYDFILYIRIDLFLKQKFIDIFNPIQNMILYPTICWTKYHKCKIKNIIHPRVNDLILFIPQKYYSYIDNINISHNCWYELIQNTNLTYDDMDTIIHTYHDSDSFKDYNPLYYIVNRPETTNFYSKGEIFDKNIFYKLHHTRRRS